jgi:hypothetical protein
MSAEEFLERAHRIAREGDVAATNSQDGTRAGLQAAKRIVAGTQRDLRALRRDLVNEERQVQNSFKEATAKASAKSHLSLQMMTGKKSVAGQLRQSEKHRISVRKDKALAPYRRAKATIDQILTNLSNARDRINAALERMPAAPNPVAGKPPAGSAATQGHLPPPKQPPPPAVPPGWYADPTSRHSQRYWDGRAWTSHVLVNGVNHTDPV